VNDVLNIAMQHHLYIIPLGLVGFWLLSRWGAEPKRVAGRPNELTKRARVLPPAGSPEQIHGRSESPGPLSDLMARADSLALRRAELEQQMAALVGPKAVEPRRRDKRKRNV